MYVCMYDVLDEAVTSYEWTDSATAAAATGPSRQWEREPRVAHLLACH